jgi:hypothetical protein
MWVETRGVAPLDHELFTVSNAVSVLRGALFLVAGFYGAEETIQIKLLAKRQTGGIKGRLVQCSTAARLADADEHQSDDNDEDRTTEVFLHEVLPVRVGQAFLLSLLK